MPALTLAVLVMRRSALSSAAGHRGAGVVAGVGVGVVLVSAAALADAAAAGRPARSGSGAAGAAGQAAQGHGQAALLVCSVPTLLVALTRSGRPGRRSGDVGGCAPGPALSKVMT